MAEFPLDPFAGRYAARTAGMSASEIRALFAVASRPEVISLAGGMPYVEALPSDEVLDVVRTVLTHRKAEALQYCAGAGLAGLKERVASLMAEEGLVADPQHIVVTEGAQQALDLLGKIFIDPGDEIAVEAPSYVGALSAFSAYQPSFLTVPLDEDGLIVEELEEALVRGARPKFLYTIPNFQNPAGVTLSGDRRRQLVTLCREAGILIIEDNPYGLLRFEGEPLPTLASLDPENVIYLGTLSKVFAPAIRVGWALAEPGVIQRLVLAKEGADLCSSALTQVVAEEWLSRDWRAPLARLVETYQARRGAMLGTLERSFPEGTSWTRPLGGFYVWVTLPSYLDSSALLAAAVERRVAYVPGTGFYPDGSGRDRLRLAFSYPSEEAIEEGVRRLGELVAEEQDLYRSLSG